MENAARSFPTKNGQCYIYEDRIEIRTGSMLEKIGVKRLFLPYLLLALAFAAAMLVSILIVNYFLAAFFAGAILFSLYFLVTNRNLSVASVIPRDQVDSVRYIPAVPGEARAAFHIIFKPKKRILKRIILLPTGNNGAEIAQSAQLMFREESLLA